MRDRNEKCCQLIEKWVKPGSTVLDISCGEGILLEKLTRSGYRVTGTNFSRYDNTPADADIRNGVDILRGLPFDAASYDAVILCDVIQHLHDHEVAIREMSRVVKPDGIVLVLTPNTNRLSSRFHFLLTGFLKPKRSFIGFDIPIEKAFTFHNHAPLLPVYLYEAQAYGLEVAEFDALWFKPKSVILWLLMILWIKLTTWTTVHVQERNIKHRAAGNLIFACLTSFKALCGEWWVIVHRKTRQAATWQATTRLPEWHEVIDRSDRGAGPVAIPMEPAGRAAHGRR